MSGALQSLLSVILGVLAIGCLASCLEEKGRMVVLPDGAGRIDLEVAFGKQQSDGILEEVAKGRKLVDECRHRIGGSWEGFAFWTDEVAEVRKDGNEERVHYRGRAWFRDASKVNLSGQPWVWRPLANGDEKLETNRVSGFTFEFTFDPLPKLGEDETRAGQFNRWQTLIEGFEVSLRIRLPGEVTLVSGRGLVEGREVTYRLTAADLLAGAKLEEEERSARFHKLVVLAGPTVAEAKVEQKAFHEAWSSMEKVGVPHRESGVPRPPPGPAPPPLPLDPPITLGELDRYYAVPDSGPDWKLTRSREDGLSEWWTGSIRGSRKERIPVIIRVPLEGRPCPIAVKQHTWHGTKESGQVTGLPVLKQGVAVVSFDGPLVGSRVIAGRDPLGESPEVSVDNHRWAVSDLRAVIRALSQAPLPEGTVTTRKGVVVVGVSLGGPTAITAFALEQGAAAGVTVVAGAGAWSAARDQEPPGTSLEGAGDMRLRKTAEDQRVAALLDPAVILPLVKPRPIAIIGGAEDGLAPETGLRRLARSAGSWPDVVLRIHPEVGHFISKDQAKEVTDWIVMRAKEP